LINKALFLFLILLVVTILVYIFFLIEEKNKITPIYIEPIVIPKKVIKEDNSSEILEKLKMVTDEVFENSELSTDMEAGAVLSKLKELEEKRAEIIKEKLEKERIEKERVLALEKELKKRELARKHKIEKERAIALKRELARKKELAQKEKIEKERVLALKNELLRKRELEEKERIAKERAIALKKRRELELKIKLAKKIELEDKEKIITITGTKILLGEQHDLHTLSEKERKNFKHLEVVSESKPFILEKDIIVKSPKPYQGVQEDVKLEELPFAKTLGVIAVSKPFVKDY